MKLNKRAPKRKGIGTRKHAQKAVRGSTYPITPNPRAIQAWIRLAASTASRDTPLDEMEQA